MKEINLNEWEITGGGSEGNTYRNRTDDSILLKLYNISHLHTVEKNFNMTKNVKSLGIKTPDALEIVKCDDKYGIIFENINDKVSLFRMVVNDNEKAEEAGNLFGEFLREIHLKICDTKIFTRRLDMLKGMVNVMFPLAKFFSDEQTKNVIDKFNKVCEKINIENESETLLMGDCHPGNVLYSGGDLYLIDLNLICFGDPIYDLSWLKYWAKSEYKDKASKKSQLLNNDIREKFVSAAYEKYFIDGFNYKEETFNKKIDKYGKLFDFVILSALIKDYDLVIKVLTSYDD